LSRLYQRQFVQQIKKQYAVKSEGEQSDNLTSKKSVNLLISVDLYAMDKHKKEYFMKQFLKSILCLTLLFGSMKDMNGAFSNDCGTGCNTASDCCSSSSSDCCSSPSDSCCSSDDSSCSTCCSSSVRTYFQPRSQGFNTARELVGWQWEINRPFMCNNWGAFYVAYEFQQTFKSERLANALFGTSTLEFSGSLVPNRNANTQLLADNFGLPRDFQGCVSFCPRIQNHIVDLGYFMGLDCWAQGLYVRFHAPIVYSRWSLRASENTIACGTSTIPGCYDGSATAGSASSNLGSVTAASSIQQALSGTFLFGDQQTNWCAGRIDFCSRHKSGLADIDAILGYNWINNDCYHVGAYIQMVLPTGTKPNSRFLFNPVIGNGHHFGLGAGISTHAVLWGTENQNLAFFFEGNVMHLFKSKQCRLFDFCKNGAFSRYMLLKEYTSNGTTNSYDGNLISATCFNNQNVNVKIDIVGDFSFKFAYRWCGFGLDLGYNLFGQSHEKINLRCDQNCNEVSSLRYSPKGTEGVCCFEYPILFTPQAEVLFIPTIYPNGSTLSPAGTIAADSTTCQLVNGVGTNSGQPFTGTYTVTVIPNNASQPNATAFAGAPSTANTTTPNGCVVDLAFNSISTVPVAAGTLVSTLVGTPGVVLCNSTNPVNFLRASDLDLRSAESVSLLTHKFFGFMNYTWYDDCGMNPNIGVGASVEFGGGRRNHQTCRKTDVNQWGILVKGGISY